MDHFLYPIFKIILSIYKKNIRERLIILHKEYINKIENRITFKIKTGYYLEILTSERMKLLGSIKSKINKNKKGENVSNLEITEVLLVNFHIVNDNYQQKFKSLIYISS